MLDCIITIFFIYGLAFLIKDSDGPWGIMSWMRNKLMQNKFVGVFFYKLFDCYFCVGCHAGWMAYLLHSQEYGWKNFILWTLAGGMISLTFDGLLGKLNS